uniref:Uncharacterized protein n=1 Tax=Pristionchus pacificus TaxID=54126 RepID=A0A2A6C5S0_PRIPA|eukprot:PDM73490.1 hypothetical protein PRIPAC_40846 [Pristionchus pacificus]
MNSLNVFNFASYNGNTSLKSLDARRVGWVVEPGFRKKVVVVVAIVVVVSVELDGVGSYERTPAIIATIICRIISITSQPTSVTTKPRK